MDNTENIFGRVLERLEKGVLNEKNGDYEKETHDGCSASGCFVTGGLRRQ